jgi:hypothetical protein
MLRNPQQEASEQALLQLLAKDPPGTRYLLNSQSLWLGENKVRVLIATVLHEDKC